MRSSSSWPGSAHLTHWLLIFGIFRMQPQKIMKITMCQQTFLPLASFFCTRILQFNYCCCVTLLIMPALFCSCSCFRLSTNTLTHTYSQLPLGFLLITEITGQTMYNKQKGVSGEWEQLGKEESWPFQTLPTPAAESSNAQMWLICNCQMEQRTEQASHSHSNREKGNGGRGDGSGSCKIASCKLKL